MAFLRIEKKKSGTYLRIVETYRNEGKIRHRTLHSLGKKEDYSSEQLERIAEKLLNLAGKQIEDVVGKEFQELGRYNYGYTLVIQKLLKEFNFSTLSRKLSNSSKVKFNWEAVLKILIAERLNAPCSKRQNSFHQSEYIGISDSEIPLHHFYRTLDLLSDKEQLVKDHVYTQRRSLFSSVLDVVFYDVTTLYFESQVEQEGTLRQKGYSKDGKAHKTQVVLGLLVDQFRNPVYYQLYQGNTYEGATMVDALNQMSIKFDIRRVIVVADTGMIDSKNRAFMEQNQIDYIIGDSIKKLPKATKLSLIDRNTHTIVNNSDNLFSYKELVYKGRRIVCTYSAKRARKNAYERQKLVDKATQWLNEPSKYKQVKKRGAGKFIMTDPDGLPIKLDLDRINRDAKFDGFKALSTTTDLTIDEILSKYRDLFEVEHTFRALKSQLEIRPVFHWTDKRIKGHVCMCFIAFTLFNHLRNITQLQYRQIVSALDKMQMSHIKDNKSKSNLYLRSAISDDQLTIIQKLKLKTPNDTTPEKAINQLFIE